MPRPGPCRCTHSAWRPEGDRTPETPSHQGKAVRGGVRLFLPPTGCIRPMPVHPSPHNAPEVGRARHARHAPDMAFPMSGRKKRWYACPYWWPARLARHRIGQPQAHDGSKRCPGPSCVAAPAPHGGRKATGRPKHPAAKGKPSGAACTSSCLPRAASGPCLSILPRTTPRKSGAPDMPDMRPTWLFLCRAGKSVGMPALTGGLPDMPDLPDIESGNYKRMTIRNDAPARSVPLHPLRMEAGRRQDA